MHADPFRELASRCILDPCCRRDRADGVFHDHPRLCDPVAFNHSPVRMSDVDSLKALGNERRLLILKWLKNPRAHFRPQVDGDLVEDGVCALLLAEKLDISQPTLSEHMRVLVQAKLVTPKRIKQWTFYKRNEPRIDALKARLLSEF